MIKAVYDSGSNISLVNSHLLNKIKTRLIEEENLFKTMGGLNFTHGRARLRLKIGNIQDTINFFVVKKNDFSYDLLLGLDAIQKFKLIQDENLQIFQNINGEKKLVKSYKKNSEQNSFKTTHNELFFIEEFKTNLNHLNTNQRIGIQNILKKYQDIFAKHKFDVGIVRDYQADIRLLENRYISKKPYRCSIPDQNEIEGQVTKLLEHNLIEESLSPFGAPVTLAFKKEDGKRSRLCIDFREINKLVVPESQPFPRIEDIVVKAVNCRWFSTFDINSAFWSIPLKEEDREKTAFVTQNGHWQWRCLPFGLKTSPAIFQRILSNTIRKNRLSDFCANYIDDILVFSKTYDDHVKHVQLLMEALRDAGYKLKLSKCELAKDKVKYLGHIIEGNGVKPEKDNLKAIRDFERPKNKKNVRQVLGKINFYYKYIENASNQLEPLHNLLRKNVPFEWTEKCEQAFKNIKNYLCSSPILAIYDQSKEVFIYTDASGEGLGAVLKQPQNGGMLHPVAYFSRRLKPTEKKMKTIHLECLAIKEAIMYWQHWLIGRTFIVVSDHKPLETMRIKARTDEPLGYLMHYLSQYDFKIIYSPGKENIEADALSRNPVLENFEHTEDLLKVVNFISLQQIKQDQERNEVTINETKNVIKKGDIAYKNLNGRQRILVSRKFGQWLINEIHEFYGHIGTKQILEILRPFYYMKNMDRVVEQFCKRCEICIKNKTRSGRPIGFLSKLGPPREPFEIMSIDTVGGLSGNRSPKKYLHILIDHFTRAVFISTSKTQNSTDIIQLIDSVAKNHNIKTIMTDRYPAMISREIKTYFRKRNIQCIHTPTNCAFSNGMNERVNQTLINRIRCKINSGDNRSWPKIAIECVNDYNNTIHSVTKFTPNYLLNGKTSEIVPKDLLVTRSNLENDRKNAYQNSMKNHLINKQRIDRIRKSWEFKVNDWVYIENGNRLNRKKIESIRKGPFRITKKVTSLIFEVQTGPGEKTEIFHCNKLTPRDAINV